MPDIHATLTRSLSLPGAVPTSQEEEINGERYVGETRGGGYVVMPTPPPMTKFGKDQGKFIGKGHTNWGVVVLWFPSLVLIYLCCCRVYVPSCNSSIQRDDTRERTQT
jgi:hypothetical protein